MLKIADHICRPCIAEEVVKTGISLCEKLKEEKIDIDCDFLSDQFRKGKISASELVDTLITSTRGTSRHKQFQGLKKILKGD